VQRCKTNAMACEAVALHALGGNAARWSIAPRQPSRSIYDRIHAPAAPRLSEAERRRRLVEALQVELGPVRRDDPLSRRRLCIPCGQRRPLAGSKGRGRTGFVCAGCVSAETCELSVPN
jgi:hypothetical protein